MDFQHLSKIEILLFPNFLDKIYLDIIDFDTEIKTGSFSLFLSGRGTIKIKA